jgi:peroxidase
MSRYLRSFRHGKLKTYEDTNLLPKNLKTGMFETGDERANENVYLTIYHTVFVREHNRVCEELLKKDLTLNDEELYQAGRNYVIGLLQKITYD